MVTIGTEPISPRRRSPARILANVLIAGGLSLLVLVVGLYSYQQIEEQRFASRSRLQRLAFDQERAALELQRRLEQEAERARPPLIETPVPVAQVSTPTLTPLPSPTADGLSLSSLSAPTPSPMPKATPPPTAKPAPAAKPTPTADPAARKTRRMIIPAIDVDSEVVEAEIVNGEWNVPKFVVGHLQGTDDPGYPGNAVYSGHIQSISSGNVFARLGDLEIGDSVYVVTRAGQYLYKVAQIKVVANTDLSVIDPTDDPTVTLITCTGTWDFVQRDYLQRLIVVAKLHQEGADLSPVRPD